MKMVYFMIKIAPTKNVEVFARIALNIVIILTKA